MPPPLVPADGVRPRLNVRIDGGPRRFSAYLATPNVRNSNFAVDVSRGRSHYKGLTIALQKRWDGRLQLLGSYTLSESTGTAGRATWWGGRRRRSSRSRASR